jgi:hypothetical protein
VKSLAGAVVVGAETIRVGGQQLTLEPRGAEICRKSTAPHRGSQGQNQNAYSPSGESSTRPRAGRFSGGILRGRAARAPAMLSSIRYSARQRGLRHRKTKLRLPSAPATAILLELQTRQLSTVSLSEIGTKIPTPCYQSITPT